MTTDHTHPSDYAPGLTALVTHMIESHPDVRLIRTRADQPKDHRPVNIKHQGEHPEVWGARATREREANEAASFLPQTDADTRPCLTVAGVQVYAYIKDGYLRVSVDLDTVEGWLLTDASGELLVPIRVQVSGEDAWVTSPGGTTVEQARLIPPGRGESLAWTS